MMKYPETKTWANSIKYFLLWWKNKWLPFYLLIPEVQNWPTSVCADGLEGKHPEKGQVVRFLARAMKCEVILRAAYLLLQQESLRLCGKILSGKKCEVRIICPEPRLASRASSVLDCISPEWWHWGGCSQVAPKTFAFWSELRFQSISFNQAETGAITEGKVASSLPSSAS